MIDDYRVMEQMAVTLAEGIDPCIRELDEDFDGVISSVNIDIDSADPDNMRKNDMIWITPLDEENEGLSMRSDQATFAVDITVICKGKPHRELLKRVFTIKEAIYLCLKRDQTLGGLIDALEIGDSQSFMALDEENNSPATITNVRMQWCKTY